MHRDRDKPSLRRMPELPVRTSRPHLALAVSLQRLDNLARPHMYKVCIATPWRKPRESLCWLVYRKYALEPAYIRNTPLPVVWVSNNL
jgi:hypothetical protein